MIKGNENLEKSKRLLNEDIKTYIREAVKEQVHNETNRKVYYETQNGLRKSLKNTRKPRKNTRTLLPRSY